MTWLENFHRTANIPLNAARAAESGSSSGPVSSNPLTSDPFLASLLSDSPGLASDLAGLASETPGGAEPKEASLWDMLYGAGVAVAGRRGITGKDLSVPIPHWAADLAPEILEHPDYDPFFGVVSQEGDERVYMGKNAPTTVPATGRHFARIPGPDPTTTPAKISPRMAERGFEAPELPELPDAKGARDTAETKTGKTDDAQLVSQVLNLPYLWDEEEVEQAMAKMREAGINVTTFDQMVSAWGGLVNRAAMMYSMSEGKRKVTPWDVLDLHKSEAQAAGTLTNYQNGSRTTVSKSVSNITEGEAWSSLQSTLSQMLGRDPTDQELRDFTYRMNQAAAANPSVSETITRYKNGEAVTSTTNTEGGFGAADVAQSAYEGAQADPEYAEYQAGTTYFNAAMTALGAIGQT